MIAPDAFSLFGEIEVLPVDGQVSGPANPHRSFQRPAHDAAGVGIHDFKLFGEFHLCRITDDRVRFVPGIAPLRTPDHRKRLEADFSGLFDPSVLLKVKKTGIRDCGLPVFLVVLAGRR